MDPETVEEFNRVFQANTEMTGFGVDVEVHMPCPFCGAAHWRCTKILDFETNLEQEEVCSACDRGARTIVRTRFNVEGAEVEKILTMVQTSGPDGPSWGPMREKPAAPGD